MILKVHVSVITGGATGIGKATVETFALQGAKVIFCDVNKNEGEKTQKELHKKGSIVNNSPISAFANVGGNLSYAASKGGVMSLTRVLAIEYAKNNIRVNAVCPGVIDTPMNERNLKKTKNKKELISKWKTITPLGRVASPYELAQTVLFLSSDMSSFITGVGLLVDGGRAAT